MFGLGWVAWRRSSEQLRLARVDVIFCLFPGSSLAMPSYPNDLCPRKPVQPTTNMTLFYDIDIISFIYLKFEYFRSKTTAFLISSSFQTPSSPPPASPSASYLEDSVCLLASRRIGHQDGGF